MPIFDLFLVFFAIGAVAALAAGLSDLLAAHVAPRVARHGRAPSDPRAVALLRAVLAPFGVDDAPTPAPARPTAGRAEARPAGDGPVVQPALFPLPVRTRAATDAPHRTPARRTPTRTTHAA
ncbi:MAG: hypothetical protein RI554_08965 [Trueperaceae bacterium]|nr:hypothetical protein [Trueperaceae bacterium]